MAATQEAATDEILSLFKGVWDSTSLIAVYENVKGAVPTAQAAWARPVVRHGPPGPQSLTGANATQLFSRKGVFTVSLFIPNGHGLTLGYTLGKSILDAYDGKKTSSGVWFRNGMNAEVGPSGEWYMFNVSVEFEYDETK